MRAAERRHLVAMLLLRHGELTRAELETKTPWGRGTLSRLMSDLRRRRVVQIQPQLNGPRNDRGKGRPPFREALNPDLGATVGVSLARRHIKVAVANLGLRQLDTRSALDDNKQPVGMIRDPEAALTATARTIQQSLEAAEVERSNVIGVGLGVPGPITLAGELVTGIVPGWRGRRPGEEVQQLLGIPVTIDNDANLGALGELTFGNVRGVQHMAYILATSGVGCGLIIHGRLYRGWVGTAGELGHTLYGGEKTCACGKKGCLETKLSVEAMTEKLRDSHPDEFKDGKSPSPQDIRDWASNGDDAAEGLLTEFGSDLGRAVANLCTVMNPQRIVVGGDFGDCAYVLDGLRESIRRYSLRVAAANVEVCPTELGDKAVVRGATALVLREPTKAIEARFLNLVDRQR